jgi:RNA polymerase sigma-70 factor, ECF subfamily
VQDADGVRAFENAVLPHLDAAYTLARYLLRDEDDARDAVQDACLRALKYFRESQVTDVRAWFLQIVRNTCHTMRGRSSARAEATEYDDNIHTPAAEDDPGPELPPGITPESVRNAVSHLPVKFREVLILREVQACSYEEIATIVNVPVGTVMSRLSRARRRVRQALVPGRAGETLR